MRAVFLNAGPLVHFAHERTSYENSIDGIGKAIIIEDDVIVSIKDSDEVVDEYSLNHDDVDAKTAPQNMQQRFEVMQKWFETV